MKQKYKSTRDFFYKCKIIKDLTGREGTRNMKQWFERNKMDIYDSNDFISFIDWYRKEPPKPKPIHKRKSKKDKEPKKLNWDEEIKKVFHNPIIIPDIDLSNPIGTVKSGKIEMNDKGGFDIDLDIDLNI